MRPVKLSVLDLSPISAGSSAAEALANTVDLAQQAEALGYARYWLAEHHNAGSLASSSPEIVIALVAAATRTLRVGSGGIMLPNHRPLKVAEWFRLLHAISPGRIDLGLGRAAGTDPRTARALRGPAAQVADDFPALFDELVAYLTDRAPRNPFHGTVKATPIDVPCPPLWVLGSSDQGASFAAARGTGFAYARHINPVGAEAALRSYRQAFCTSEAFPEPHAVLAVSVVCAETDEEAERLASGVDLAMVRFGQGARDLPFPTLEESLAYRYTADEEVFRREGRARHVIGVPSRVRDALLALAEASQADEIMVMTHVHAHAARRRSYALLAEAFA